MDHVGEYFGSQPVPAVQIWADAGFELTGDGSAITITGYNPSYDTVLGPALVTNGPTAGFVGNANSFFGVPDGSNPLFVADFTYEGSVASLGFDMVGQNSYIDDLPPGGSVRLYQDAAGNPGDLTWDVIIIPAPATLALAPMVLVAARRRRK
ncbi:MAG: hypothetical protein AAFY46_05745 [Planctomycetota bacterium]